MIMENRRRLHYTRTHTLIVDKSALESALENRLIIALSRLILTPILKKLVCGYGPIGSKSPNFPDLLILGNSIQISLIS